jgi:hypothetical protein
METSVGRVLAVLLSVATAVTAALTAGYTARYDFGLSPQQIRSQAVMVAILIGVLLAIDYYGKKLRKPKWTPHQTAGQSRAKAAPSLIISDGSAAPSAMVNLTHCPAATVSPAFCFALLPTSGKPLPAFAARLWRLGYLPDQRAARIGARAQDARQPFSRLNALAHPSEFHMLAGKQFQGLRVQTETSRSF